MTPGAENAIERLTDQQALSIVQSLAGELASDDLPQDAASQAEALNIVFRQTAQPGNAAAAPAANVADAGRAARELLKLMQHVPEMRPSLNEWLASPPRPEAAAIPIALAAPVVLTGCLVILQVAGHMFIKRQPDGKWHVEYDPARETKLDSTMAQIVTTLAELIQKMSPSRT